MNSDFPVGFFGLELDLCVTWARMHARTHAHTHSLTHLARAPRPMQTIHE